MTLPPKLDECLDFIVTAGAARAVADEQQGVIHGWGLPGNGRSPGESGD